MLMRPAGYRFLAGHRIRVSVASSAWPVTGRRCTRRCSTSTTAHYRAATWWSSRPPAARRCAGARLQDHAARRPGLRWWQAALDEPSGGSRTMSSPGSDASVHDGGEDVLDDTSTARRRRDPDHDRLRRRPARQSRRRRRLSVARAHLRDRDPARSATSDAEAFHLTVDLEVDVDGEPFFRRAWSDTSNGASSDRSGAGPRARLRAMARSGISAKAERFSESVIREVRTGWPCRPARSASPRAPRLLVPARAQGRRRGGGPRRHQPVRHHRQQAAARPRSPRRPRTTFPAGVRSILRPRSPSPAARPRR